MTEIICGAAVVIAVFALAAAVWSRHRAKRIMKNLNRMLDAAMAGTFAEQDFDESLLSAVESRFAHYLAANAISAQKLQEEKDKIKTLIADISHQTKTPVANILLYTQLLAEQDLSPEGRNCAAALEGQVEKLRALVEALVKTSRLEAGILALHPKAGPLAPMLEDAAAQFAPRAAEKGITLTLAPTDATAVFDPKWTAEAVCNLLDNAIKYTPAGGTVAIEVIPYQMFCRINVTDTGPGIPEAERAKVFQRFYRSPAAYETEGVGIGLYLARQIAEGQGGYIKVSSQPGQGSCFSVYLPRS
ncbi:MAG: HAMP domain-containing histidine kinase [Oscillibacter sp.]|nr:HAMP domain-containing histidine kinase [Oscillibacter sp.]